MGLLRHRLVPLEAFAEIVCPDQSAPHQHIQRAIDGRGSYLLAFILEQTLNCLDREMLVRHEHGLSDEISLAGDRKMVIAEMPAKPLQQRRSFTFTESGHRLEERATPQG